MSKTLKKPHRRLRTAPPLVGEARELRSKPPLSGEVARSAGGVLLMAIMCVFLEVYYLNSKSMFTIKGNICAARVRLGRAMHKPPLTQQGLAIKVNFLGLEMTKAIISRIERGERHVVDAELKVLAQALGVSMDWLTEEYDPGK